MDTIQLISHIDRLLQKATADPTIVGVYAEICEFLRIHAGPKSEFLALLKSFNPRKFNHEYVARNVHSVLLSFRSYVEAGLQSELSPERRAQLDVVSDFLEQAQQLLEAKSVHPGAPTVIIGAALEEFLRTWVENEGLGLGGRKSNLDSYSKALREADIITKRSEEHTSELQSH